MPEFIINEGVFSISPGWEDRSVTVLTFPAGEPVPFATVTVTRETIRDPNQSLPAYVDQQLAHLAKTCEAFQLIRQVPTQMSGLAAVLVDFMWTTPEKVSVRQVIVITFIQPQFVVVTATASVDRFANFEAVFYNLINSFRTRTTQR